MLRCRQIWIQSIWAQIGVENQIHKHPVDLNYDWPQIMLSIEVMNRTSSNTFMAPWPPPSPPWSLCKRTFLQMLYTITLRTGKHCCWWWWCKQKHGNNPYPMSRRGSKSMGLQEGSFWKNPQGVALLGNGYENDENLTKCSKSEIIGII